MTIIPRIVRTIIPSIVITIIPRPSAIAFPINPMLPPTVIYTMHIGDDGRSGGASQIYGCYGRYRLRGRDEASQQQASCSAEHNSLESHVSSPLPKNPAFKANTQG